MGKESIFWKDLAQDLEDPEFLRAYIVETVRITTIDSVINQLDQARSSAGLTKADMARAVHMEPAAIRRLMSAEHVNPTLGTLAEVAAVVGMRITLEPLSASEREYITRPLIEGTVTNTEKTAKHLHQIQGKSVHQGRNATGSRVGA